MYNQKPLAGDLIDYGHPLSQGIAGLWLFNEGSGNQVYDLSGNGNDGILQSDLPWDSGKYGSVLHPDGTADYVALSSVYASSSVGSVVIGFSLDTLPADGTAQQIWSIGKTSDTEDYIFLHCRTESGTWAGTRLRFYCKAGNVTKFTAYGSTELAINTFYHVDFIQDGTEPKLYLNGIEETLTFTDATDKKVWWNDLVAPDTESFGALVRTTTSGYIDGKLEFASIYKYNLSASEVALLSSNPFCMVRTKRRRIIYDGVAAAPPTTFPYYYREIASRRIA